jgi:trk system potassium uptake protein TrkH
MRLPLFLLLFGLFSALMLFPAAYGWMIRDMETARIFLQSGLLGLILFGIIAFAHRGRDPRHGPLGPLVSLLCAFLVLPAFLAIPFYEVVQTTSFVNAYIEMVSSITTTGATLFDDHTRLNSVLHLWRAFVGWMGGMLIWVAASAILAPMNLGGFEVTARAEPGRRELRMRTDPGTEVRQRIRQSLSGLVPIYIGLTLLLAVLLMVSGDRAFVAGIHAMSVMATSGISATGGIENAASGMTGEVLMLLFFCFALSRLTFSADTVSSFSGGLRNDPEMRLGFALLALVPTFLFLRHWLGTLDVDAPASFFDALRALWGSVFTVFSFLTTTGFTSADWTAAQDWSGLRTPGLVLMGLALIGGGVATTAGGVKLLRVFALAANGRYVLHRLVYPSSISSAGPLTRRLQKDGAFIAWIFFMLFAISLAAITILLSAMHVPFENAIVMAISGLSTTGPLLYHGGTEPVLLSELATGPKLVFTLAMIVGRLETLAIIALLTPDLWRG